jgi:transcriptional regulator with PAS, ATPase and Fis domain
VVLVGATGTGKEVMATALHEASKRKGPFVAVNCGAIPEKLIESELFGYRRGAFSGADEDREGLVRRADGGTLFLDEVGELSAKAQVALLRVLQEKEVLPVGATRPVEVDVRIVAAAQTELGELVREERFRADLLARLSGIVIVLPRLAERKEDVGLLVSLLLRRVAGPRAASLKLSIAAVRALFAYDWPLNVRELERALESAVLLAGAGTIDLPHLPKTVQEAEHAPTSPPVASPTANRDRIVELLQSSRGNVSAVARAMGKTRAQIHRWIKQYSLDVRAFRR